MRTKHIIVGVAAVAGSAAGLLVCPGVALASPTDAPGAHVASFDCGPAGSGTVVVNSGNSQALTWNPFFVTLTDGRTAVFTPTAYNETITQQDGTVVWSANTSKGSATGTLTCALSADLGRGYALSGSVTGNIASN